MRSDGPRRRVAAAAWFVLVANAPLSFDRVFTASGESAWLHARVRYVAGRRVHALELWRDHDRRIKRRTDGTVATFVTHRPGSADFSMTILDRARRISTTVKRTNLYRIGSFTDWFALGHGLAHPKAAYRLIPSTPPQALPKPVAPCRWYALVSQGRTSQICWDAAHRLPLLIVGGDGNLIWRAMAIDTRPVAPEVFTIDDRGYVRNDANRDIERD